MYIKADMIASELAVPNGKSSVEEDYRRDVCCPPQHSLRFLRCFDVFLLDFRGHKLQREVVHSSLTVAAYLR